MLKPDAERNWVLIWAAVIVLLSSVPYLYGLANTPPGWHFVGLTHNIDDGAVYLSWMRQAADGGFFIRNLYTTESQPAVQFNLLFLIMGWFAAITRLPLIWVFHIFRAGLGIGLIWAIWRFAKLFMDDPNERRILIPLVGLSAGVGWLIPGSGAPTGPVDTWQPEAITFLSIYLNPLFLAGLILMIGAFYWLVLAHRTGSIVHAVLAGIALLLLGNIHTYDVLTVACVWTAYLIVDAIAARRVPVRTIALSALAAAIAAPSVAYQFYVYASDPIYRARVNTPVPSPPIWSYFAGYGLVLIGAAVGAGSLFRIPHPEHSRGAAFRTRLLPIAWAVVGFAVPYIPVAQQRKLVMGLHIPLCILCAIALSRLLSRAPRGVAHGALLAFILFTMGSNVSFVSRDMLLLGVGDTAPRYAPYVSDQELAAMAYLRDKTDRPSTVFAPPSFALFVPAIAGRQVYYGHWSETPDYGAKIRYWTNLVKQPDKRLARQMLIDTGADYYVYEAAPGIASPPPLKRVFCSDDVAVYRIPRR